MKTKVIKDKGALLVISLYVAAALFNWLDYLAKLTGYATLEGALLYTILTPILIFASHRIRQIKSIKFWQLTWAILGALIFGFVIFSIVSLLLNRILCLSAWMEMDSLIRIFLTMSISYAIGAYLGYRLGKIVGFRPQPFKWI